MVWVSSTTRMPLRGGVKDEVMGPQYSTDLILRSVPKGCVSKDGNETLALPSFETRRCAMLLRMRTNR